MKFTLDAEPRATEPQGQAPADPSSRLLDALEALNLSVHDLLKGAPAMTQDCRNWTGLNMCCVTSCSQSRKLARNVTEIER
jgi:hypothetical protein